MKTKGIVISDKLKGVCTLDEIYSIDVFTTDGYLVGSVFANEDGVPQVYPQKGYEIKLTTKEEMDGPEALHDLVKAAVGVSVVSKDDDVNTGLVGRGKIERNYKV